MSILHVLAIDGPVASGKGTVARAVASALGFHLLDSGAIYRAFALSCLQKKTNVSEINSLSIEAKALSLEFSGELVIVNGADATNEIRTEAVGMLASQLSAIPEVRTGLLERQRAFARAPGLVADGRDMGTVVFPGAQLKVFLTATAEVRGVRRFNQLAKSANATTPPLAQVVAQIRQRDDQDKSRPIAPLQPANDAIVIDNALQSKHETTAAVLALWALRGR